MASNNSNTNNDSNNNNLKIFTIRCVPEELRKRWRIAIELIGNDTPDGEKMTMERFAVEAIQEKVERFFSGLNNSSNSNSSTKKG